MKPACINIPEETLQTWQSLLNLIALKFQVPAALIMKVELPDIVVFLSSETEGNPYKVGDSEHLIGSGLYCERVINTKSKLVVPDALKSADWNRNPDIKLGMISYMGFPVRWPSGEIFGTTCVLDSKENPYTRECADALLLFSQYIEGYLGYAVAIHSSEPKKTIKEKDAHCYRLLLQVESFFAQRKSGE